MKDEPFWDHPAFPYEPEAPAPAECRCMCHVFAGNVPCCALCHLRPVAPAPLPQPEDKTHNGCVHIKGICDFTPLPQESETERLRMLVLSNIHDRYSPDRESRIDALIAAVRKEALEEVGEHNRAISAAVNAGYEDDK